MVGRRRRRILAGLMLAASQSVWAGPARLMREHQQSGQEIATSYESVREQLSEADRHQRQVMGSIYEINGRIKKLSDKRNNLTGRILNVNGNVRDIARQIAMLEDSIKDQRRLLSRNLRTMYRMNAQSVLRILFANDTAHDFDRSVRFLKILAKRDVEIIRAYQKNVAKLKQTRTQLAEEVKHLKGLQSNLKVAEKSLENEQRSKSRALGQLDKQKQAYLRKMEGLREIAQSVADRDGQVAKILEGAFFERKGRLMAPVEGSLAQGFGLMLDSEYRYRLVHKGHSYAVGDQQNIRAVAPGVVAFSGALPGYGEAVVLNHGDHYYTVYARAEKFTVKRGQSVSENESIGLASPKRTEASLYFEIRHFSEAIDPTDWFKIREIGETQHL